MAGHRRSVLCGTFLRVTPTGSEPASCPAEPRPSSTSLPEEGAAVTRSAHRHRPVWPVTARSGTGFTWNVPDGRFYPLRRAFAGTSNTSEMETLVDIASAVPTAPATGSTVAVPAETLPAQWHLRGACRGLDLSVFYPDPDSDADVARALEVCSGCSVRDACLDHAVTHREMAGIWGGTTEGERRRILRRRRSA